jgi:drug/metabolite transporter (DMT)-like permease
MTARQLAMLLGLAALWGASFLFMRVAVPSFGPIVLADARVALAGVVLFAYAVAIGARPVLRERWRDYLLLGTVNAALPFSLLAAAQLELEASLAAVLNAMAPLCGALVAAVWLGERVSAAARLGLVLGVVGVALVVGLSPFTIDVAFLLAVLACLAAAFAYGIGANVARVRFVGEPPLSMAVGQQLAAAVVLLPLIPAVPLRATPDAVDVLCLFALALGSTGIAYLLYFRLLRELGAAGGMTAIFVVPVFGVLWGALFLGERIHLGTVLGGAVIMLSVWLITRTPAPARAEAEAREDAEEPATVSSSGR